MHPPHQPGRLGYQRYLLAILQKRLATARAEKQRKDAEHPRRDS